MKINLGIRRPSNYLSDTQRAILRRASTAAIERYGVGGRLKKYNPPKPITLPKLKCQSEDIDP